MEPFQIDESSLVITDDDKVVIQESIKSSLEGKSPEEQAALLDAEISKKRAEFIEGVKKQSDAAAKLVAEDPAYKGKSIQEVAIELYNKEGGGSDDPLESFFKGASPSSGDGAGTGAADIAKHPDYVKLQTQLNDAMAALTDPLILDWVKMKKLGGTQGFLDFVRNTDFGVDISKMTPVQVYETQLKALKAEHNLADADIEKKMTEFKALDPVDQALRVSGIKESLAEKQAKRIKDYFGQLPTPQDTGTAMKAAADTVVESLRTRFAGKHLAGVLIDDKFLQEVHTVVMAGGFKDEQETALAMVAVLRPKEMAKALQGVMGAGARNSRKPSFAFKSGQNEHKSDTQADYERLKAKRDQEREAAEAERLKRENAGRK